MRSVRRVKRGERLDGLRVGVAQVRPAIGDVAANLRLAARHLRNAARRGAVLVVFPECFLQGYRLGSHPGRVAEPASGPNARAVAGLARLAARHRVAVVAGFIEAEPARPPGGAPSRPYNSALVIDRDGRLAGVYRKTHLFGREADVFAAGADYPVHELHLLDGEPPVRLGVCICYDVEFPEVPRILALRGAELLAVPSADMDPYRAQQASQLVARAIENGLHVALANTVDRRPGAHFFGGSGIADPLGKVVSAGYDRPRLAVAVLSAAAIRASGGPEGYLSARRPETYGDLLRSARP